MRFASACSAAGLIAVSGLAAAQGKKFAVEPVVLDGSNSTGATVGIQWSLSDNLTSKALPSDSIVVHEFSVDYKLSGIATAEKERNPKNFIDALLEAKYLYSDPNKGAASAGLFGKFETDQSIDNRQSVYGLRATIAKLGLLHKNNLDFIALDSNLGRVNPSKDLEREAVLGTSTLDQYYRWDLEFLYIYPLAGTHIDTIELNYRYFRELDAPAAVKAADLHRYRLRTLRVGLKNDLFVAYSKGKLPFDRTSDKIFEIGWSHNLK